MVPTAQYAILFFRLNRSLLLAKIIMHVKDLPRNGVRYVVRNAQYLKNLWEVISMLSLIFCNFKVCCFVLRDKVDDIWIPYISILVTCFAAVPSIICVGLLLYYFTIWLDGFCEERAHRGDFYRNCPSFVRNLLRFLANISFPLTSAVLGYYMGGKENDRKIFMEILWSFVVFVLTLCMSLWTAEDFGAADSSTAIILGLITMSKSEDKALHLGYTAAIPALKHLFIPLGRYLVVWAEQPTYAEVAERLPPPRRSTSDGHRSSSDGNLPTLAPPTRDRFGSARASSFSTLHNPSGRYY